MNSSASEVSKACPGWRNRLVNVYLVQRIAQFGMVLMASGQRPVVGGLPFSAFIWMSSTLLLGPRRLMLSVVSQE